MDNFAQSGRIMGGPRDTRLPASARRELVGRRLQAAREALGLNRAGMADALDVDRSVFTKIETGQRLLPPDAAIRACDLYGLTLEYLYRDRIETLPEGLRAAVLERLAAR